MKAKKKKTGGRKQKFGEATDTVAFRLPVSKIEEIKQHVKAKQELWAK